MHDKVLEFLKDIRPECDFSNCDNFIEAGYLDSFDIVTLVTTLDEEYGISIVGTDILPQNFLSVEAICRLLVKNGVKA